MAQARKITGKPGKIFVLIGDGESQEGTTWESILIAAKLKLDNLVVILDNNGIQGSGFVKEILPVVDVVKSAAITAGWNVFEIDGHNDELLQVPLSESELPVLIIANTVKGKGVSFMENQPKWHSNWLAGELEEKAMAELS
jgi:transketolase